MESFPFQFSLNKRRVGEGEKQSGLDQGWSLGFERRVHTPQYSGYFLKIYF